jgi:hypothetical protein
MKPLGKSDGLLHGRISIRPEGKFQITTNQVCIGSMGDSEPKVLHEVSLTTDRAFTKRHDPFEHGLYSFTDPLRGKLAYWSEMLAGFARHSFIDIPQQFFSPKQLKTPDYSPAQRTMFSMVFALKGIPSQASSFVANTGGLLSQNPEMRLFLPITPVISKTSDQFLAGRIKKDPENMLGIINQFYTLEDKLYQLIDTQQAGTVIVPPKLLSVIRDQTNAICEASRQAIHPEHQSKIPRNFLTYFKYLRNAA